MATQAWLARFSLGSNANTFILNNGTNNPTLNLTAGQYYIAGYTSEATAQLCEHIQATMQASTGYSAATCTFSYTTGRVSLGFAATTSVTWTDTDLRDLLGFTGNLSGATSYTATNRARYVWMPSRDLAAYPVDKTRLMARRSNSYVVRAKDGTTYGVVGALLQEAVLNYALLPDTDVLVTSTSGWNVFEQLWLDAVHGAQPIRLFTDNTSTTSTAYTTLIVAADEEEPIGSFIEFARRHMAQWNGLWNVQIPVRLFQ